LRELVGQSEQRDIDLLIDKILRDLGRPEPPLDLRMVRELLRLDRKYYSSTDVGPLAEFAKPNYRFLPGSVSRTA
jgi:hypothetical protein